MDLQRLEACGLRLMVAAEASRDRDDPTVRELVQSAMREAATLSRLHARLGDALAAGSPRPEVERIDPVPRVRHDHSGAVDRPVQPDPPAEPDELDQNSRLVPDTFKNYLKKIGAFPLLSRDAEVDLMKSIEAGLTAQWILDQGHVRSPRRRRELDEVAHLGRRAQDHMIESNQRLVVSLARRYPTQGMEITDLVQEGNLGLMHAVQNFDYRLGNKFSTYATWWIRQAITRGIGNHSRLVRLPIHIHDRLRPIDRRRRDLGLSWDEVSRNPSALGEDQDLEDARLASLLLRRHLSIEELQVLGPPSEPTATPTENFIHAQAVHEAAALILMVVATRLGDRSAQIMELRAGYGGEPETLEQIGARFGITRERVRQLYNQALAMAAQDPEQLALAQVALHSG